MQTQVITYNAAKSAATPGTGYGYPAPSGRVVTSNHRPDGRTAQSDKSVRLVVGKDVKFTQKPR